MRPTHYFALRFPASALRCAGVTILLPVMLFVLPLWQDHAAAARPTGVLNGTVLGPTGKAVTGARVFLQVSDGSHPHTTKTDVRGYFRFSELRQGNYDVRAQAEGQWSDWEHNVLVRSGRETLVTLRLLLKQPPAESPRAPAAKPAPAKPPR